MTDNQFEQLKMIQLFQANATATGFYLLVKKGLISIKEYNSMLEEARKSLIVSLSKYPSREFDLEEMVNFAFDAHIIPENMEDKWEPAFTLS